MPVNAALIPEDQQWTDICALNELIPNRGVCALVNGQQVALFYLAALDTVFAIDNYDPFGKANVLSRGIVGDLRGEPVVASPLYKQHFCLRTGRCLEHGEVAVATFPTRIVAGRIQVGRRQLSPESRSGE